MSTNDDERQARLAKIRAKHVLDDFGMVNPATGRYEQRTSCKGCHRPWPCEQGLLLAELEVATARAERRKPCPLALEYRDGVVCSEYGDADACAGHQVVRGLRQHGVDADRFEIENRELRARVGRLERQVRAAYGIIHDGLHGGKPIDPEHQEQCQMPSCRNARAVLAEGA